MLEKKVLTFDGAMGTMLQRMGLSTSECPEIYNLHNREIVKSIHQQYLEVGCHIIQTNTFGANKIKLQQYGLGDKTEEINRQAVLIAKEAAYGKGLVAGDIGPTGKFVYPLGEYSFEEIYQIFFQQAKALIEAGVDLINIETMSDIKEAKAAVMAVKDAGDIPVTCTMTFQENMRTLTGADPETVATVLESLGVDVLGVNCGFGPDMMIDIIKRMSQVTDSFLMVQPNAGLPKLVDGETIFDLSPEKMAGYVEGLIQLGANIIGGCCGTTPEHLQQIVDKAAEMKPVQKKKISFSKLASARKTLIIGDTYETRTIGGYINPTGKKYLTEMIKSENTSVLCQEAAKQVEAGAHIININLGVDTLDESKVMKNAVLEIQRSIDAPIALDTVNYHAMEEGLKGVEGKALLNSTNGKEDALHQVLDMAKRYGAAVVGLTLDEKGIPQKAEDRVRIAEKIVTAALDKGLRKEDIYIDTLVLTAGAQQDLALECLKAIRLVKKELGVKTVLGVENISHGLPNRSYVNNAFLAMALQAGLDLPIINPYHHNNWTVIKSTDVLVGKDKNAKAYIQWSNINKNTASKEEIEETKEKEKASEAEKLMKIIKQGDKPVAVPQVKLLMEEGMEPVEIINNCIIPALEKVGENYEKQIYFLPQLLLAAEAAQSAFQYLKEFVKEDTDKKLGTVVIATVKGDIHDIGKNIVAIMLENQGFHVIDLGKDIATEVIIETALKEDASIIGLSALMTTTMQEMKKVVATLQARNIHIPVMVGGAVVTEDYAREIGAYYAADAIEAVKTANKIMYNNKKIEPYQQK